MLRGAGTEGIFLSIAQLNGMSGHVLRCRPVNHFSLKFSYEDGREAFRSRTVRYDGHFNGHAEGLLVVFATCGSRVIRNLGPGMLVTHG